MSNNTFTLNVKGAQHVLRSGTVLLGSTTNDRYRTILIDDKSICPKHASIRYDPATSDLEVMDLCSVRGVTVDQRPIRALTWCKVNILSQILLGAVPVSIEREVPGTGGGDNGSAAKKSDLSCLLDDDSHDFIDCSLEETQLLPVRKELKFTSGLLSGSQNRSASTVTQNITPSTSRISLEDRPSRAGSFLVPATQQLENSANISTVADESLTPAAKPCIAETVPEKTPAGLQSSVAVGEQEDEDDYFFIPETQQSCEEEHRGPSPTIGTIAPFGFEEKDRLERTEAAEEEYFQMTVQDDENSNDGLFNNKYVEESQNLLQNMDEAYKRVDDALTIGTTLQSILPERSVDSISFQEHRNTTQDMSRLEWNETRPEHEQSLHRKLASAIKRKDVDRSITPELYFDEPVKDDRDGSVTPDVDFDKVVGEAEPESPARGALEGAAKGLGEAEPQPPERAALEGGDAEEDDEHEISLNQEGCKTQPVVNVPKASLDFDKVVGEAEPEPPTRGALEGVAKDLGEAEPQPPERAALEGGDEEEDNEHEIPLNQEGSKTQPVVNVPKATSGSKLKEDVNDIETQVLDFDREEQPVSDGLSKENSKTDVYVYDMETQVLIFDDDAVTGADAADTYDLLTQPMVPPKQSSFMGPPRMLLAGEPNRVTRRSKEPAPGAVAMTADDFLTQPMIPPDSLRNLFAKEKATDPRLSTSSRGASNLADVETVPMFSPGSKFSYGASSPSIDPADLLTQPMSPPKYLQEDGFGPRKTPVSMTSFDAYNQPTQPLNSSLFGKKLFVKLVDIRRSPSSSLDGSDPYELQTQLMFDSDDKCNVKRSAATDASSVMEISHFDPPVNSTVRYSQLAWPKQSEKKELDISPSSNKENKTRSKEPEEEQDDDEEDLDDDVCLAATLPVRDRPASRRSDGSREISTTVFKVPSTERIGDMLITPKPTSKGDRRPVEITEFLTPEHPLLSLPKPDSILMASGHMRDLAASHLRSVKGSSKYHFNDSSSGSDEDERSVFRKTNVSVALERELEKMKGVAREKKNVRKERGAIENRRDKKVETVKKEKEKPKEQEGQTSEKRSKRRNEKSSSSSSGQAKGNEVETEPVKRSSREKTKKDAGKGKDSSRGKEEKRTEKQSSSNSSTETIHSADRVVTRRGREVWQKTGIEMKKQTVAAAVVPEPRSTRIRQKKEARVPPLPSDEEEPPAAPAPAQRRESKRQKGAGYHPHLPSCGEPPAKKKSEAPPKTATSSNKVEGVSTSTNGMSMGSDNLSHEGRNGGLANVSATSSNAGSDGSTRPARTNRPRLIFTRMNPEPYRKCIARAGGKVVDIPDLANVLVTDRIFRTYKFLCAVARGIPIVGQSYLDALQAANEHDCVDPWDHILRDEATEKRYKFRLRDSLLKARVHKLFQDYTVFVTSSTQPPPSELYLILSCAGVTPLKHPGQPVKHSDKMFVISDPSDGASWPKYKETYPSIEIVSTEGFMLSIMQHSISLKKHRLM